MKTIHVILYKVLIVFIVISSCTKKEELAKNRFDLSDKVLQTEEVKAVAEKINDIIVKAKSEVMPLSKIEREYENALSVLVDNGKVLYKEIIDYIELNDEVQLTDDEINQLSNINDQHLVELSLIMSFVFSENVNDEQVMKNFEGWDVDRAIGCIGVALGINEIAGLISNTSQLTTIHGTTQLLKTIGRRYLGWVGVAVGVYSFGRCLDAW